MKQQIYGFSTHIYPGHSVKYAHEIQSPMRACFIFIENAFIKHWILKTDWDMLGHLEPTKQPNCFMEFQERQDI